MSGAQKDSVRRERGNARVLAMRTFLTLRDVIHRTGIGRSTIYRRVEAGDFPRPYELTEGRVAWKESEIEAWMIEQQNAPIRVGSQRGKRVIRRVKP